MDPNLLDQQLGYGRKPQTGPYLADYLADWLGWSAGSPSAGGAGPQPEQQGPGGPGAMLPAAAIADAALPPQGGPQPGPSIQPVQQRELPPPPMTSAMADSMSNRGREGTRDTDIIAALQYAMRGQGQGGAGYGGAPLSDKLGMPEYRPDYGQRGGAQHMPLPSDGAASDARSDAIWAARDAAGDGDVASAVQRAAGAQGQGQGGMSAKDRTLLMMMQQVPGLFG